MKFYLDTSIWMDIEMNRKGFKGEPLGEYGAKLLIKIISGKYTIIVSDILVKELKMFYEEMEINSMFEELKTERVLSDKRQRKEAEKISKNRKVPKGDALHAIIARDGKYEMITRDKHFKMLKDICKSFKPEELI